MQKMGPALLIAAVGALLTIDPAPAAAQGNWTTIKGQVVLAKDVKVPAPAALNVTADKEFCLKNGPVLSEEWIINKKNGGIKNVVLWIEPAGAPRGAPFPKDKINPQLAKPARPTVEIDQPCCQFVPHVLAAREGQDLIIKNSASKPHNAKWDSSENGQVNPLLPPGQSHTIKGLKAERSQIPLTCSIHPWMKAWVRIYDHPYFAVTDDDGKFEIKDAPQGAFTLYVWHESGWDRGKAGAKGQPLKIAGATLDLKEVKFTPAFAAK